MNVIRVHDPNLKAPEVEQRYTGAQIVDVGKLWWPIKDKTCEYKGCDG